MLEMQRAKTRLMARRTPSTPLFDSAAKIQSRIKAYHFDRFGERQVRHIHLGQETELAEVHPELVFLRLNGGKPLPRKKSEEGDALRRKLLKRIGFHKLDRWLTEERIGKGAKRDDVLDACAVALAARGLRGCLPEETQLDAFDLPMQIWF